MYLIVYLKTFGEELLFTTSLGNEFHTGTTLTEKNHVVSLVTNNCLSQRDKRCCLPLDSLGQL